MSHAPGLAMNRHCASGLAAVQNAAASIRSGMDRVMVAGGTQSSSTMPRTKRRVPGSDHVGDRFSPTHPDSPEAPHLDSSIQLGWNAALAAHVPREDMDALALRPPPRAGAALSLGHLHHETLALEVVSAARDTQ